jgi:hypothetical protein
MQAQDAQSQSSSDVARGSGNAPQRAASRDPIGHEYADIRNRFTYHPPSDEQVKKYEQLRTAGGNLAMLLSDFCPPGREKQLALTQLEQSIMWANASIAREPEVKYYDEVTRVEGAESYTATRHFTQLGQVVHVDVPAMQLGLPIGQGLSTDQINRRVLALAAPALDQATNDLKSYVRAHPGVLDDLDSKGSESAIAGTIDGPSTLGAEANNYADEQQTEETISRR